MNFVITGASGFIGAHFIRYLLSQGHKVIAIDSFRHKGTWSRLNEAIGLIDDFHSELKVFHHNLCHPIDDVLARKIDDELDEVGVFINCASNSAVNRSIEDPRECWENNTAIAINVLEYLRKRRDAYDIMIQLSTDEVYGDYGVSTGNGFKEWSSINPSNPYAASKAAQEALFISYWRTYQMPIAIANTMNNIGEWQDPEKFIPLIVSRLSKHQTISVYADEGVCGSRVYLDVLDHARMMEKIGEMPNHTLPKYPKDDLPYRVNLCGKVEIDNMQMVLMIGEAMGRSREEVMPLIKLVPPAIARPGYDKRYLLDPNKFQQDFPQFKYTPFKDTISRIVNFTLQNKSWME